MRKTDYALLAQIIARMRDEMRRAAEHGDDAQRFVAATRAQAGADIAQEFARHANVDRAAFLRECGMSGNTQAAPETSYSLADIRNGTGWPKGARFVLKQ